MFNQCTPIFFISIINNKLILIIDVEYLQGDVYTD